MSSRASDAASSAATSPRNRRSRVGGARLRQELQAKGIDPERVRAAVAGQSGTGAFMALQAPQGAKLVAVKSAAAGVVEIHEMKLENDVMKMRAIPALDLPAGEQIKLAPGGLHLMMMDLKQPITAGQTLSFTLTLEDANGKRRERQIEAQVRSGAGAGQGDGHGAHQHH